MSSQKDEKPAVEAFPPTDFREFIDSIQGSNATGKRFLDSMAPYRPDGPMSLIIDVETAQRNLLLAEALLEKRRDLNGHYDWVLASDAALVYKVMGGKSENGAVWARRWMEDIHAEYGRVGRELLDVKLELENLVRPVESE